MILLPVITVYYILLYLFQTIHGATYTTFLMTNWLSLSLSSVPVQYNLLIFGSQLLSIYCLLLSAYHSTLLLYLAAPTFTTCYCSLISMNRISCSTTITFNLLPSIICMTAIFISLATPYLHQYIPGTLYRYTADLLAMDTLRQFPPPSCSRLLYIQPTVLTILVP